MASSKNSSTRCRVQATGVAKRQEVVWDDVPTVTRPLAAAPPRLPANGATLDNKSMTLNRIRWEREAEIGSEIHPVSLGMAALLVVDPGLRATIQGHARPGRRAFGVPPGGAFDCSSLNLANALLGNPPGTLAIELTMFGGSFQALADLPLALAGAPFDARVRTREGRVVRLVVPQSFTLAEGDRLSLGGSRVGLRAYLAVRGGWQPGETPLRVATILEAEGGIVAARRPVDAMCPDPTSAPICLIDGPDGPIPSSMLEHAYVVNPSSDRIGLRLDGPAIGVVVMPGRLSAPVSAGAVQVTGAKAIILGVDGGTMGGYPHVADVITADLDRLGQARPGDTLRFVKVSLVEARRLDHERRTFLAIRDRRVALGIALNSGRTA